MRSRAQEGVQLFCHPCRGGRSARGFSQQAAYQFCAACTAAFEHAATLPEPPSAGQFVRDNQFGEESRYEAPPPDDDVVWRAPSAAGGSPLEGAVRP